MSGSAARRPLRADATRNRTLVLAAAREVYALRGNSLTMDEVALRAGVGKATLYRTFSTRDLLIAEMARDVLADFSRRTKVSMAADESPADALRGLLRSSPEQPGTGAVAALFDLDSSGDAEIVRLQREAMDALDQLLERGRRSGTVRPGITSRHITALLSGLAKVLPQTEATDPAVFDDYVDVILDGLLLR